MFAACKQKDIAEGVWWSTRKSVTHQINRERVLYLESMAIRVFVALPILVRKHDRLVSRAQADTRTKTQIRTATERIQVTCVIRCTWSTDTAVWKFPPPPWSFFFYSRLQCRETGARTPTWGPKSWSNPISFAIAAASRIPGRFPAPSLPPNPPDRISPGRAA